MRAVTIIDMIFNRGERFEQEKRLIMNGVLQLEDIKRAVEISVEGIYSNANLGNGHKRNRFLFQHNNQRYTVYYSYDRAIEIGNKYFKLGKEI